MKVIIFWIKKKRFVYAIIKVFWSSHEWNNKKKSSLQNMTNYSAIFDEFPFLLKKNIVSLIANPFRLNRHSYCGSDAFFRHLRGVFSSKREPTKQNLYFSYFLYFEAEIRLEWGRVDIYIKWSESLLKIYEQRWRTKPFFSTNSCTAKRPCGVKNSLKPLSYIIAETAVTGWGWD